MVYVFFEVPNSGISALKSHIFCINVTRGLRYVLIVFQKHFEWFYVDMIEKLSSFQNSFSYSNNWILLPHSPQNGCFLVKLNIEDNFSRYSPLVKVLYVSNYFSFSAVVAEPSTKQSNNYMVRVAEVAQNFFKVFLWDWKLKPPDFLCFWPELLEWICVTLGSAWSTWPNA